MIVCSLELYKTFTWQETQLSDQMEDFWSLEEEFLYKNIFNSTFEGNGLVRHLIWPPFSVFEHHVMAELSDTD